MNSLQPIAGGTPSEPNQDAAEERQSQEFIFLIEHKKLQDARKKAQPDAPQKAKEKETSHTDLLETAQRRRPEKKANDGGQKSGPLQQLARWLKRR